MTILRDISFLWSMIHVLILFLLLFEPRYSWRITLIASFTVCGALTVGNMLLMTWQGPAIIMRAAIFTCTIPSALLFFLLSRYRDGRFFFLFCLTDTMSFWLLQITNLLDRLAGETFVVLLLTRLVAFPLMELFFWRYLRRPYLNLQRKLNGGWWLFTAIGAVYYLLIMVTSVPVGTLIPDATGLLRQQMERTETEYSNLRSELAYENLRILQESSAALAQARHDILGNLGILQTLSSQGDYKKLDEYLARITKKTREIVPLKFTGHPIVNAV